MGIVGRSASTNPGDVMWSCDICGRSWVGADAHTCGGVRWACARVPASRAVADFAADDARPAGARRAVLARQRADRDVRPTRPRAAPGRDPHRGRVARQSRSPVLIFPRRHRGGMSGASRSPSPRLALPRGRAPLPPLPRRGRGALPATPLRSTPPFAHLRLEGRPLPDETPDRSRSAPRGSRDPRGRVRRHDRGGRDVHMDAVHRSAGPG
jgi:hypothetical protein